MKNPKRVFVFCDNLIGDFLMQSAGLRGLRVKYPDSQLIYCTPLDSVSLKLVQNFPGVDKVMTGPMGKMLREKGDLWIDAHCTHAHSFAIRNGCNMTEAFTHLWDTPLDGVHYSLNIPQEYVDAARALVKERGWNSPVICARHSSSCSSNDPRCEYVPNKCFANREWVKVASWLKVQGMTPVAVGSQRELEDARYEEWPGEKLYGEDIMLVAALQKECAELTISVDTGIRHLAAAVGCDLYTVSGVTAIEVVGCAPQPGTKQAIIERVIPPSLVRGEDLIKDLRNCFFC